MKKKERDHLLQVCRMRAKVAKAEVAALAAKRKSAFEVQLASIYSFDNDAVWKRAFEMTQAVVERAGNEIACRSRELGIPADLAPTVGEHWHGRGENATRERRAELTRVAHRKIDQLEKEAKLEIERTSVEIQTRLVADGLESADAKAFLDSGLMHRMAAC